MKALRESLLSRGSTRESQKKYNALLNEADIGENQRGCDVVVKDLSYWCDDGSGVMLEILCRVSAHFQSGEMCAVMGSSGAGKSTFLDLVAGRKSVGITQGDLLFNNRPRSSKNEKHSAYVMQDDVVLGSLTVRESLQYAARFRLPHGTRPDVIDSRVRLVMDLLELTHIADSRVGGADEGRGISGGERKRLCVGIEIIHFPNLIFLDEPTSGLDAGIALEVMSSVRRLTDFKRTVFATIHQPGPDLFSLFDKVMLLRRGSVIYFGPVADVVSYLTSPTLGFKLESYSNPADFMLKVASKKVKPIGASEPLSHAELVHAYESSDLWKDVKQRITSAMRQPLQPLQPPAPRPGTMAQFRTLLSRTWTVARRDRVTKILFVKSALVALFYGSLHYQLDHTFDGAIERFNLFFYVMLAHVLSNFQAIVEFFLKKVLYRREKAAGLYGTVTFLVVTWSIYLYLTFLTSLLFTVVLYWIVGLNSDAWVKHWMFGYALQVMGVSMMILIGVCSKSSQAAFIVMPFIFLLSLAFAGFLIPVDEIPAGYQWLADISFSRWGITGFSIMEFEDTDCWPATLSTGEEICFTDEEVLDKFNAADHSLRQVFGFIFMWIGAMTFLTIVVMRFLEDRSALEHGDPSLMEHVVTKMRQTVSRQSVHFSAAAGLVGAGGSGGTVRNVEGSPAGVTGAPVSRSRSRCHSRSRAGRPGAGRYGELHSHDGLSDEEDDPVAVEARLSRATARGGCTLIAKDLGYSVSAPGDSGSRRRWRKKTETVTRQIVSGVSMCVRPSELCAIMGPSGAGKSTLLDVLAGWKTTGDVSGQLLFNGKPRVSVHDPPSAYVLQDDLHLPTLSVRETLEYAALFRMPVTTTPVARQERIDLLVGVLGLKNSEDTYVGGEELKGISGGERKRLSIGVEIINLPNLIFLDEPTSGLDSEIAFEVISSVREICDLNRTAFATVHQPSPELFQLFDKVLLMAKGQMVYFGAVSNVVSYFSDPPLEYRICQFENPADFILNIASMKVLPPGAGQSAGASADLFDVESTPEMRAVQLARLFATSTAYAKLQCEIDTHMHAEHATDSGEAEIAAAVLRSEGTVTPLAFQFKTLIRRAFTVMYRTNVLRLLIIRNVMSALIYGSLFYDLPDDTEEGVSLRVSVLFQAVMNFSTTTYQAIPDLCDGKHIFLRERNAGAYSTAAYCLVSFLVYLPILVLNTIIFSTIIYFMVGLRQEVDAVLYFYFVAFLTQLAGLSMIQMIASRFRNSKEASGVAGIPILFVVFFMGYAPKLPDVPSGWKWATYIPFARYSFAGLAVNEIKDYEDLEGELGSTVSGQDILDDLDFGSWKRWSTIVIVVAFAVVQEFFVYRTLKRTTL
eukprot:Rmarinus@m.3794